MFQDESGDEYINDRIELIGPANTDKLLQTIDITEKYDKPNTGVFYIKFGILD